MHNGFYSELDELLNEGEDADFGFMENEVLGKDIKYDGRTFSAFNFLHGFCNVFAQILNEKYGYSVECIYNEAGRLVHCFCIDDSNGKLVFIDVRGKTDDYFEFVSEFEDEVTCYGYPVENTKRFDKVPDDLLTDGEHYKEFANNLIDDYSWYYQK